MLLWEMLAVVIPLMVTLIGGFAVLIWRLGTLYTEFQQLKTAMEASEKRIEKHEGECVERMRRVYVKLDELGRGMAIIEGSIDAYGRLQVKEKN